MKNEIIGLLKNNWTFLILIIWLICIILTLIGVIPKFDADIPISFI